MIEALVLVFGLFCKTPDFPTIEETRSVLTTGWPSPSVFGSSPYDLPTEPSDDGAMTYRITVDPMYLAYGPCFYREVRRVLDDPRTWDGLRQAAADETPQFWIILTPPGAACQGRYSAGSCASDGQVRINIIRWASGYGQTTLADSHAYEVNHEIGHILGHGHINCSVMGYPEWHPATVSADPWDTDYDSCGFIAWPNVEAWLLGGPPVVGESVEVE
jgi:hypothetical protein